MTIQENAIEGVVCTDEELLALIVRCESIALGTLYDRYGRLVFTIALRITGECETAEEVTQDVFQQVWQSAGGFQTGTGSFSPWLMGIAGHRAIDATRSRRFRARAREEDLSLDYPSDEASNPEYQSATRALCAVMYAALDVLPLPQRQVIELAYYGGLTHAEIATRLDTPPGTVKTRMRLGMQKLKALLTQVGGEQEVERSPVIEN